MRALWLENQKLVFKENVPEPILAEGEALIRVRLAGVCSTDLELVRGYYPFTGIPGHEFVGEVESVNAPSEIASNWVGKRVVGEINAACGECEACQHGDRTHCERRTVLGILQRNGVFAECTCLPVENLHQVPETIPDEVAVFTEPLAAALEIQQQIQIHPEDRVLLIGAGRLGQLIAQSLALTGCQLQVLARHPYQKELLSQRGIALIDEVDIPNRRLDVVIEATGSEAGFHLARRAVRPRGTIVLKSTYAGESQVNMSSIVVDEISLIGSRCGPFSPALRLLEAGVVDPMQMIMDSYPIDRGVEAFGRAAQPGVLKILLTP